MIDAGAELFWALVWLAFGVIMKRTNSKTGKVQWFVLSKDRKKRLGGPYSNRAQAEKRLRQVEYYKRQGD